MNVLSGGRARRRAWERQTGTVFVVACLLAAAWSLWQLGAWLVENL